MAQHCLLPLVRVDDKIVEVSALEYGDIQNAECRMVIPRGSARLQRVCELVGGWHRADRVDWLIFLSARKVTKDESQDYEEQHWQKSKSTSRVSSPIIPWILSGYNIILMVA